MNLAWAVDRVVWIAEKTLALAQYHLPRTVRACGVRTVPGSAGVKDERNTDDLRRLVLDAAQRIADEDVEINKRMAEHGATLINDGDTIIHHCNISVPPSTGDCARRDPHGA